MFKIVNKEGAIAKTVLTITSTVLTDASMVLTDAPIVLTDAPIVSVNTCWPARFTTGVGASGPKMLHQMKLQNRKKH